MEASGKVALVTGAARRVGRAIALELAQLGCDVALHYRHSAAEAAKVGDEVRHLGRRALLVAGDLADPAAPAAMVDQTGRELGRLDILVNNASDFSDVELDDWTDDHWETVFRVNLFAPAMLAKAAVPLMQRGGNSGRIINLADILADRPIRRFAAYCASKAAVVSLTRSLARELAPGITVNAIAPGIAVFPDHYGQELREKLIRQVPLKRAGSPEEIAATVGFLVAQGDYITGQVLNVDGGRSIVP